MGNGSESTSSWLVPAVVGALVALTGTGVSSYFTNWKDSREHTRGIAAVRAGIIESVIGKNLDLSGARLSLDYVLKPIDETGTFDEFSNRILEIFNEKAPQTEPGPDRDALPLVAPPVSGGVANLIGKFSGAERLAASNALINLSRTRESEVVNSLISSIIADNADHSYRVNLYIVFTLARIPGGWHGTDGQFAIVKALEKSANYIADSTFRKRTNEALENWKRKAI